MVEIPPQEAFNSKRLLPKYSRVVLDAQLQVETIVYPIRGEFIFRVGCRSTAR
ncbi:MAG: hypothetical protein QW514_03065 [Thermoprotei archaeon]